MSNFQSIVYDTIRKFNMLKKGDRVVVALSGGADSVSLLNVLLTLKDKLHIEVMAAHLNHNLRGDEAKRDENFVKNLCKKSNVKLFCESYNVAEISKKEKISTELCGRNLRYEFFEKLHLEHNAKIATAHTSSDNAETVVFNLIRGTGLKGMGGIVPVRDYIIRPLIEVSREQVETYCNFYNIHYVTDSTNLTNDYTRNKIRHEILPKIKEINPNFERTVGGNSPIFLNAFDFISNQSDTIIERAKTEKGYRIDMINSLDYSVKTTLLSSLCKIHFTELNSCHMEQLIHCLNFGGSVDLPNNIRAICKQNLLRFADMSKEIVPFEEINFSENLNFSYNCKHYSVKEINLDNSKDILDKSSIKGAVIRTRKEGDTFTLPHRKVTKTLKKLFNEMKIPAESRNNLLLVANGSTVLWIEGIGVSAQGICKDKKGIKISITK
ncbi:MAG: tRNA lysidine(34) synthetase TilS [Oscillospiraceae bacterium]|nr:tRNA lysidine(34) synthetase TilS [Oscillospiraceae bacterium]